MNAWTEIKYGGKPDKDGVVPVEVVKPGERVSQKSLNCSDEDWAALVNAGSVRSAEYPDLPSGYAGSPKDFIYEQRKAELEAAENIFDQNDVELQSQQATDEDTDPDEPEKEVVD